MKTTIGIILLILCLGCSNHPKKEAKQENTAPDTIKPANQPSVTTRSNNNGADDIAFGFSNNTGQNILLLGSDSISTAAKFTFVISNKGLLRPVTFVRKKQPVGDDNGRQNYQNFENSGGFLFSIKSGMVDSTATAILLSSKFISDRTYIKLNGVKNQELPDLLKQKIEATKGRKIKKHKELAIMSGNRAIYLIEFEAKGDSVLASLVFAAPGKVIYKDYPAKYDSTSTWSVDDGGEFDMDYYFPLAVFEQAGKIEIITEWISAEGASVEFMAENNNEFKTIKQGYRYLAPL
ncbi:MAG: hypothetical protein JWR38_3349 [Mucilaginibacter sp.]|nr:hypothetical protein [Mucilaginibacter sp.]